MNILTIPRPDDWHLHVRDGAMLGLVAPLSRDFGRAIIMPNLVPPITNAQMAVAYHERIVKAGFAHPLMTLYLTQDTTRADIDAALDTGIIHGIKLYPAGATTNSDAGVRDIRDLYPLLSYMAEKSLPLLVHGEVTNPEIDIFDREAVFIETVLDPLHVAIPDLRIVFEHVTTKEGVDYVKASTGNLGATITVHHLLLDRNDLLVGGVKPHFYCLPVLKRATHRTALVQAALWDQRFFLGTDSAPHPKHKKECTCCAAGVFSAPNAMPWLAQIFETHGALDQLAAFACENGPRFYGLPVNRDTLKLERVQNPVSFPKVYGRDENQVTLFEPSIPLYWRVKN